MLLPLENPRQISPLGTYKQLVSAIQNYAVKHKAPGAIIGLSGTDSLLTFLATYEAFANLGKAHRVKGVNFIHDIADPDGTGPIQCNIADQRWFCDSIFPWLNEVTPLAELVIDDSIKTSDDNMRWGRLRSLAIKDMDPRGGGIDDHYHLFGTINATEKALGTYSLAAVKTSLAPITNLYKSEVLLLCEMLGVPQIAIDKSHEIDCDCGRFDIQANHLHELDLYLMAQAGHVSHDHIEQHIDPNVLDRLIEFYIEETENNSFRSDAPAEFKNGITVPEQADYENARVEAVEHDPDIRIISAAVPYIVTAQWADAAHDLVTQRSPHRKKWMAERFALMGTAGLSELQKAAMISRIYKTHTPLEKPDLDTLANVSASLGQAAFSFPLKRWTSMGFDSGPSLIERAGFKRQTRPTDLRDETLPPSNPERDEFGTGFIWQKDDWYIEQRRAYLLISCQQPGQEATLIIRNSSHFFGRDRLEDAVYVCFDRLTEDDVLNLSPASFQDDRFIPFQDILGSYSGSEVISKINKTAELIGVLHEMDLKFSQWLKSGRRPITPKTTQTIARDMFNDSADGLEHLKTLLKHMLIKHIEGEKPGSPLYLATLPLGAAPWSPENVTPIDGTLISALSAMKNGKRPQNRTLNTLFSPLPNRTRNLSLITGRTGDFPVFGKP